MNQLCMKCFQCGLSPLKKLIPAGIFPRVLSSRYSTDSNDANVSRLSLSPPYPSGFKEETPAQRRYRKKYLVKIGGSDGGDFIEWFREGVMMMTHQYEVTPESFQRYLLGKRVEQMKERQILEEELVDNLGMDLAVAHLVTRLGGAVRVKGLDRWFRQVKGQPSLLPTARVTGFQVEAIDLAGTHVMYEGLEYMAQLEGVKFLRLRRCPFLTDHCLGRLTQLNQSLIFLDLSYCPQLTHRGLATLSQMKNLRRLVLYGNPFLEEKELVSLLLEERLPDLFVEGVDFLAALSPETRAALLEGATRDITEPVIECESVGARQ